MQLRILQVPMMMFFKQPNFSIKKINNILRNEFGKVDWRKMIYNDFVPSKCLFVNWFAIYVRLPTCDRLNKVGI